MPHNVLAQPLVVGAQWVGTPPTITLAVNGTASAALAAYNSGTTYVKGDSATSGGVTYISILSANTGNAPATSTTYWQPVVYVGNAQNFDYRAATAYVPGNVITYGGVPYVCIANSTANLPTNATYFAAVTGYALGYVTAKAVLHGWYLSETGGSSAVTIDFYGSPAGTGFQHKPLPSVAGGTHLFKITVATSGENFIEDPHGILYPDGLLAVVAGSGTLAGQLHVS